MDLEYKTMFHCRKSSGIPDISRVEKDCQEAFLHSAETKTGEKTEDSETFQNL